MSALLPSVIDAIGNTPLIRLRAASEATGCEIYGKAEFMNPGGSVKDRAALGIIRDAEARGLLQPGGLIVEGTAGNTGIGLAMVGRMRSAIARLVVIPRTQSEEKKAAIRLAGAELMEVDAVPYANPGNYVRVLGGRWRRSGADSGPTSSTTPPTATPTPPPPGLRFWLRRAARWTPSSAPSGREERWRG